MLYIAASYPSGFKVRSMADMRKAVTEYIAADHEHVILIDEHTALFLWRDNKHGLTVSIKQGDLYDMWNATIQIPDNDVFRVLWRYRKYINAKFFYND